MNGGWRYSVTVPSWTQASLQDEEAVVFYRVEVSVMPPEHHGEPRTRSVLRRFSHFQKLQRTLKEELGKDAVAGQNLAPPRWTPFSVARRPEQIERRRRELEAWLWRLIAEPRAARSRVLNQFLELADAARLARSPPPSVAGDAVRPSLPPPPPPAALRSGSVASRLPASEDALSEFDDTGSDTSFFAAGSVGPGGDPHVRSGLGSDTYPSHQGEPFGGVSSPFGGDGGGSPATSTASATASGGGGGARSSVAELRLGLRVEHRGNIRRLVRSLQERLEHASHDLQDAVERMRTDQETKRELYERVTALEAAAAAAGSSSSSPVATPQQAGMPPGSPSDLGALLAAERQRTTDLQKALQDESGRILELQSALAALTAAQPSGGGGGVSEPASPPGAAAAADAEAAVVGSRYAAAVQEGAEAPAAGVSSAEAEAAAARSEAVAVHPETTARAQAAAHAEAALEMVRGQLAAAQSQLAEEQAQNRAKQKLLAREVKSLRKQLEEAKAAAVAPPAAATEAAAAPDAAAAQPLNEETTAASAASAAAPQAPTLQHRTLLAEVAALRQRLADCAVESMAAASEQPQPNGSAASADAGAAAAGEQLLQTSDDRIQALAAEAALLADDPGTWSEEERQMRGAFATVLQENAQLHKAVNAALRAGQPVGSFGDHPAARLAGGGSHSVFARFSGGLGSHGGDRGGGSRSGASPPKEGSGFAELRNRLSNRFKSTSSPEALADD